MLTNLLLPDEAEIQVDQIEMMDECVTIRVSSVRSCAACPDCHTASRHLHGHYQRQPADVACGGRCVKLAMQVRRYFCDNPTCPRRTFGEYFPGVVAAHARRTERLAEQQQAIAFATGGEAGARLL